MAEGIPTAERGKGIVPRRVGIVPRRLKDQLAKQLRYRHFEHQVNPNWTSYASQRHVRDIAFDRPRNLLWLATWGGVLCISATAGTRHTSEHGLNGNATRCIAVDETGVVWAAGHYGGLSSLLPEEASSWQVHDELSSYIVLRMAPKPGGGIYAALRNAEGHCAIHPLTRAQVGIPKLTAGDLAAKEIEAMLVDQQGVLWTGNVWGLYRYEDNGPAVAIENDRMQVCALATSIGGGVWIGTNRGLYRVKPGAEPVAEAGWPRQPIVSLAEESASSHLWVATADAIGRVINNVWQPVLNSPPDRFNVLRLANTDTDLHTPASGGPFSPGGALVGGANGLYHVGPDEFEAVMTPDSEDALSNAVQCLWANGASVWIGAARGLTSFDGKGWTKHVPAGSQLRDVRALLAGNNGDRLWIGAWGGGLHRLEAGECSVDSSLAQPLVSMSAGADGTLWAATVNAIYCQPTDAQPWQKFSHPNLSGRLIQCVAFQLTMDGANKVPTLWIGTSLGLLRYRPKHKAPWDWNHAELDLVSVQSLAIDPLTNQLWIGTSAGLFSEHEWKRHRTGDVRALAFGPAPECELFVGMAKQLERWPTPADGAVFAAKPAALFSSRDAGLAAEEVTALAVRAIDKQQREVWIGSPVGVSSYRYSL